MRQHHFECRFEVIETEQHGREPAPHFHQDDEARQHDRNQRIAEETDSARNPERENRKGDTDDQGKDSAPAPGFLEQRISRAAHGGVTLPPNL